MHLVVWEDCFGGPFEGNETQLNNVKSPGKLVWKPWSLDCSKVQDAAFLKLGRGWLSPAPWSKARQAWSGQAAQPSPLAGVTLAGFIAFSLAGPCVHPLLIVYPVLYS